MACHPFFGQGWAREMFQVTRHDFSAPSHRGAKADFRFVFQNLYLGEHPRFGCADQLRLHHPQHRKPAAETYQQGAIVAHFNTNWSFSRTAKYHSHRDHRSTVLRRSATPDSRLDPQRRGGRAGQRPGRLNLTRKPVRIKPWPSTMPVAAIGKSSGSIAPTPTFPPRR